MTSHSHTTSCLLRQIPCQTGSTTFHRSYENQAIVSQIVKDVFKHTNSESLQTDTEQNVFSNPQMCHKVSLLRHMSHRRMPISLSACLFVCSGCICRLVTVTHPWPSLLLPSVQHTSGVKVSFQHLSSDTLKSPT